MVHGSWAQAQPLKSPRDANRAFALCHGQFEAKPIKGFSPSEKNLIVGCGSTYDTFPQTEAREAGTRHWSRCLHQPRELCPCYFICRVPPTHVVFQPFPTPGHTARYGEGLHPCCTLHFTVCSHTVLRVVWPSRARTVVQPTLRHSPWQRLKIAQGMCSPWLAESALVDISGAWPSMPSLLGHARLLLKVALTAGLVALLSSIAATGIAG
jgi:hypothetical protein